MFFFRFDYLGLPVFCFVSPTWMYFVTCSHKRACTVPLDVCSLLRIINRAITNCRLFTLFKNIFVLYFFLNFWCKENASSWFSTDLQKIVGFQLDALKVFFLMLLLSVMFCPKRVLDLHILRKEYWAVPRSFKAKTKTWILQPFHEWFKTLCRNRVRIHCAKFYLFANKDRKYWF